MSVSRGKFAAAALVSLAAVVAFAQAGYSFTINGKQVPLDVVEKNGKVYVDASAAFKALGASVTFDKAKKSYVIVTAGQNQVQAVQGTTQLAGGEGVIGKTYSLGRTDDALNFTLNAVEYTVTRLTNGSEVVIPKADEKLIVLHYTVQNPQKREMSLTWSSFKFTAVDARDTNHVGQPYPVRDGTTERISSLSLKPAQKIDLMSYWMVPAAGITPKLIVERGSNNPVLRYDLRGKVKGLAAPFADSADVSGATAREEVPAATGSYYPLGTFDLKLESVSFTTDPILGNKAREGKRFLVVTFSMRNGSGKSAGEASYGWSTIRVEGRDADGDSFEFEGDKAKATRDERSDGRLKPGEETRFRAFAEIPADLSVKSITVREGQSRSYTFDVSSQAK
ncbi:MAG TPA: hypothetical protein VNT60_01545 [Deinococcales bacterium]|nr:hypothetical protein [Deinococcales bacterium]